MRDDVPPMAPSTRVPSTSWSLSCPLAKWAYRSTAKRYRQLSEAMNMDRPAVPTNACSAGKKKKKQSSTFLADVIVRDFNSTQIFSCIACYGIQEEAGVQVRTLWPYFLNLNKESRHADRPQPLDVVTIHTAILFKLSRHLLPVCGGRRIELVVDTPTAIQSDWTFVI